MQYAYKILNNKMFEWRAKIHSITFSQYTVYVNKITKQAHFVVKPRLMMLHKWNVTMGTIPSLAEAWLRPCDDNKPASTQSNVWTAFRSAGLVSDTLHCELWIRLWLRAQHIASSAPNTAGSPGPRSSTSTTSGPPRQERREISVGRLHGVR